MNIISDILGSLAAIVIITAVSTFVVMGCDGEDGSVYDREKERKEARKHGLQ